MDRLLALVLRTFLASVAVNAMVPTAGFLPRALATAFLALMASIRE